MNPTSGRNSLPRKTHNLVAIFLLAIAEYFLFNVILVQSQYILNSFNSQASKLRFAFKGRNLIYMIEFIGVVCRSRRYCNTGPTPDSAGASSRTPSPYKNQFNIEEGRCPSYQILS